ncbi:mannose-1-phosphate guanylyltransferase RfbM family protein [Bacteriovorax sp. BSW11_IV]|uniref:mannose-1-phosphate guanylyltransferase n=1 Tax=Bacteriovorax sp. BSW11_IV TaxID=1353529 RepID=UPI00038A4C73|nr:mannose-1-phosphate guanylyltransferase [Bacteriovorax sp. BSW11_IV]EQC50364.1 mannose-1-phosphate guanylyltransferase RfbM family protein [Bacteriovorax sp. BSW11_IV]
MSLKVFCLVMAGGRGTRFWPESTQSRPKQFLNLTGDTPLLSQTLERFDDLVNVEDRFIVTVKEQEELVRDSSQDLIGDGNIIFEPAGRNTAPCILLSLARLIAGGAKDNDLMVVVPSDHVILNKRGFQSTIRKSIEIASERKEIVTIGIIPHFPHTGFGYIERGEAISNGYRVNQFKEKPDFETAKNYLSSGNFYWNAGMFVAPIKTFKDELFAHSPEISKFFDPLLTNIDNPAKLAEIYSQIPEDSIDYAVMEKSSHVSVCPAEFDWNDLGSWDALEAVIQEQEENTIVKSKGHYFENAKGNIIFAPDKFVSLINVDDLIVVSNEKSVVVLPKKDSQRVKNIVEYLKKSDLGKDLL